MIKPGNLIEVHPNFRRYGVEIIGYPLERRLPPGYWKNTVYTTPDVGPVLLVEIRETTTSNKELIVVYDGRLYLTHLHAGSIDNLPRVLWRKFQG